MKKEMTYSEVYTYYVSYKEPKEDRKEYHFYSSPVIEEYLHHEKIEYIKDDKKNFFKVLCIKSGIKDKEIERLNNIINELEKYLRQNLVGMDNTDDIKKIYTYNGRIDFVNKTLDKLNELKGDSSNGNK